MMNNAKTIIKTENPATSPTTVTPEICYAVGLMSGTSVDGIDAAVIEIRPIATADHVLDVRLLAFENKPFVPAVREQIFRLFDPAKATIDKVGAMHTWLGELYAEAAQSVLALSGLQAEQVMVIGSHGQTIYHAPEDNFVASYNLRCSVQIGDGAIIANRTGIACVSDFRVADMALGGQGAPLVPFTEYVLFREETTCLLLQNIGGIGNMTVLPAGTSLEEVFAFDTGPGNMIIDGLVALLYPPLMMDVGGKIAAQGTIVAELLEWLQADDYYTMALPKSTGRERFGEQYVAAIVQKMNEQGWQKEDVITTVTYFTAWTIVHSYHYYVAAEQTLARLIVSGGGSYNSTLMGFLQKLFVPLGIDVCTQEEIGGNSDAKEAVAFALLAFYTMERLPNTISRVTGATAPAIMGKISYPTGRTKPS
ncbi:anhydro-N-acetylmuramic acid kinase [Paenibacillus yanchengensis]|uniref:Anhydro-N-acetylmuramic acid kinase n=1 Tax=Paenibacillus yanchengensis TaxID=2035833 RepID=A0ABW4YFX8_9BACL